MSESWKNFSKAVGYFLLALLFVYAAVFGTKLISGNDECYVSQTPPIGLITSNYI